MAALLFVSLTAVPAVASPDLRSSAGSVNLRLNAVAASRVIAAEGAAQENDNDMPKAEPKVTVTKRAAGEKAPEPPKDRFAVFKDWPFWVIVGGVIIAAGGTYMLLRNANSTPACDTGTFNSGCFGSR